MDEVGRRIELVMYEARQLGIKDGALKTMEIFEGRLHLVVMKAYLVALTDRCFFLLCFWPTRDHIAKSMFEEHLCVVALTSIERGAQFFPLASYFLV